MEGLEARVAELERLVAHLKQHMEEDSMCAVCRSGNAEFSVTNR